MTIYKPNADSTLPAIVYDAKRFILRFGSIIEKSPLQTYCAALAFSPRKSEIRRHFWNQKDPRIKSVLHVEKNWNPLHCALEGHSDWVRSVAFSPDGKLVAVSDWATKDAEKLLLLPPDYRATCGDVWDDLLVLGHSSGAVSIFQFN